MELLGLFFLASKVQRIFMLFMNPNSILSPFLLDLTNSILSFCIKSNNRTRPGLASSVESLHKTDRPSNLAYARIFSQGICLCPICNLEFSKNISDLSNFKTRKKEGSCVKFYLVKGNVAQSNWLSDFQMDQIIY